MSRLAAEIEKLHLELRGEGERKRCKETLASNLRRRPRIAVTEEQANENGTECDCHVGSYRRNRRVGPRRESNRAISVRRGLPIGSARPRLRHPERLGAQPGQRGRRAVPRLGGLPRPPLDCPGQSRRDLFPGRYDHSVRQWNDLAARPGSTAASAASAPVNAARGYL